MRYSTTSERNLQIVNPALAAEWNYEKNEKQPYEYAPVSGVKVWWKCKNGHEWQAKISDRSRGNGCPYCSNRKIIKGENDLQTVNPALAAEWNYEKNKKHPYEYAPSSSAKVWWKCKKGHEWQAYIYSRIKGNGCPYCAGQRVIKGENDLQTVCPEFAKEWDYEKNGELTPDQICYSSGKAVYWKCIYGHSWKVDPNSRVSMHSGCPTCSADLRTSFPEQAIYYYCKQLFERVYNQYPLDNGQELDVFIDDVNIGIEYDGIRYHQGKRNQEREERKNRYCKENGIKLFRVKETRESVQNIAEGCIYRLIPEKDGLDKCINELFVLLKEYISEIPNSFRVDTEKDRNAILKGYLTQKSKLDDEKLEKIKGQWDYKKNVGITPEMIYGGSHKKFWWICEKGHSYYAAMYHRTADKDQTGCPYCSNQKVLKGFNDLESQNSQLLSEWNYEKNKLLPSEYTYQSYKKVWWKCKKGHEWEAGINKRANGRNCPYCAGKKCKQEIMIYKRCFQK